jgi:hypothetical protein
LLHRKDADPVTRGHLGDRIAHMERDPLLAHLLVLGGQPNGTTERRITSALRLLTPGLGPR